MIAIIVLGYFILAFLIPTYRVWKSTGINPISFSGKDNANDFIGKVFKLVLLLIGLNVLTYIGIDEFYKYTMPFDLKSYFIYHQHTGMAITIIALFIIAVAQYEMSNSWRIGIDQKHHTALITSGIFKRSRNPIFLGVQISLAGLFLITPNVLMLLLLVLGVFCIQIQVRLEEEHLSKNHSEEYLAYKEKVRRWI